MKCKYIKGTKDFVCEFKDLSIEKIKRVGIVKGGIKVYGTDYYPDEDGRVFIQLLDEDGKPIDDALCLLDMFYPDKTIWFYEAPMIWLNVSKGLYYFDFVVPPTEGIYMITVQCFYVIDETFDYADSVTVTHGVSSGSVQDTWKDDNVYYTVTEKLIAGGGYALDFYFDFYNVSIPSNVTGMTVYWVGRWTSSEETVYFEVYDWCTGGWVDLVNNISTNTPTVSNFISVDDHNISCLVSGTDSGTVRVRLRDKDWSEKVEAGDLMTDFIDVQMKYATYGQINNIRGGGEVHVHSPKVSELISSDVWRRYLELYPYIKKVTETVDPQVCIDNQTLLTYINYTFCIGDSCQTVSYNTTQVCPYGCDTQLNECKKPPYIYYAIMFALLIGGVIIYKVFR